MQAFDYVNPDTIAETTQLLEQNQGQAKILAGGTDLLVQIRERRPTPQVIIDIKQIPELNELSYDPVDGLTIGAGVSCFRIWNDPVISSLYPGLVDATSLIGGIQIQSRATLGGNVGNASPAADSIPALIVHETLCEIAGPQGERQVAVEDFCSGPGQNILDPDEFLVRFRIKTPVQGFGAHYLRFIPRNEMDIAVANAGASVVLAPDGEAIQTARVAIGAVAPTPLLVYEISDLLSGQVVSDELINEAGQLASNAANPISDVRGTIDQRKHLAGVLTRRTLHQAVQRARETLLRENE